MGEMQSVIQLREVDPKNQPLLDRVFALRVLAWRPYVKMDETITHWSDTFDKNAKHWAVFYEEQLIAAARLSIHKCLLSVPDSEVYLDLFKTAPPPPIASLNRLVVHPDYRGLGLSLMLDQVRLEAAAMLGCRCVLAHTHAGAKRIAQVLSQGFEILGECRMNEQGVVKGMAGTAYFRLLTP